MVRLDRGAAVGLRAQLEHQLRESVRSGTLRHGAALPSTRALAASSGSPAASSWRRTRSSPPRATSSPARARRRGSPRAPPRRRDASLPTSRRAPRFDFHPGAPDVALFPRAAWAAALRQALRDAPDARFGYGDPRGTPELRIALATYLGRVRGVAAEPDDDDGHLRPDAGAGPDLPGAGRARRAAGRRRGPRERRPARADRDGRPGWFPIAVDGDGLDVDAARAQRRRRGARHPGAPVPDRRRARARAARRAARVGGRATPSCSRTTTTPSTATTASRSARCRASTPGASST